MVSKHLICIQYLRYISGTGKFDTFGSHVRDFFIIWAVEEFEEEYYLKGLRNDNLLDDIAILSISLPCWPQIQHFWPWGFADAVLGTAYLSTKLVDFKACPWNLWKLLQCVHKIGVIEQLKSVQNLSNNFSFGNFF